MAFPDDFTIEFVPRSPVSPFGLELENSLDDQGVSWQIIDDMLAMEVETHRRCFPAQPPLSALQRYNRRKCAFLLRDLAAAAYLPPHCALLLPARDSLDPHVALFCREHTCVTCVSTQGGWRTSCGIALAIPTERVDCY